MFCHDVSETKNNEGLDPGDSFPEGSDTSFRVWIKHFLPNFSWSKGQKFPSPPTNLTDDSRPSTITFNAPIAWNQLGWEVGVYPGSKCLKQVLGGEVSGGPQF